jgi:hypothetical protein
VVAVNNTIDLKKYRFYTITTGYCPHTGPKDNTKRKQESQELYFIAPLQGLKYNNTLSNLDSCRKRTILFISRYYY